MGCLHYTANIPTIRLRGERVGPTRSANRPPPSTPRCSYFLKIQDCLKIQEIRQLGVFWCLNPFFGGLNLFFGGVRGGSSSVMPPLPGALPTRSCEFFCQATSTGGGAHHLALLGRAVPPILLFLEGKGKGSHAYDSMAIRKLRPLFSCPDSGAPGISCAPGGYLVFGLLSAGFLTGGIVRDTGEHLRGVVCPRYGNCGRRFGGTSGDGLGRCIS